MEVMLVQVMATLDAIKKHGHFKAYKEAQVLCVKKQQSRQKLVYLCLTEPAEVQESPRSL